MKKNRDIDIIFRNGLRNYEETPPIDVWDNISKATTNRKWKRTIIQSSVALVLLCTLSFFSYRIGLHDAFRLAENRQQDISYRGEILESNDKLSSVLPFEGDISTIVTNSKLIQTTTENGSFTDREQLLVSTTPSLQQQVENSTAKEEKMHFAVDSNTQTLQTEDISINNRYSSSPSTDNYTFDEFNKISIQIAESGETSKAGSHRWTLAAMMTPSYKLDPGVQSSILSSEKNIGSLGGGLSVIYALNDKVSIQSGLFYNAIRSKITGISSYSAMSSYNVSDTRGVRPMPLANAINRNLHYLEIPMYIRYKLLDTRVNFNLLGGLSSNILVGNEVSFKRDGSTYTLGTTDDANDFLVSGTVGVGVSYGISKHTSFYVEPMAKYYITPIADIYRWNNRFSFGIFSGVAYTF